MEIQTTRFGIIEITQQQAIMFPQGLIGFPDHASFALLHTDDDGYFSWLQSIDDPSVAFLLTRPEAFFKDYQVPVREQTEQRLALARVTDGQVYVICNRVGDWLTGNLIGPIVINPATRLAEQVVLTEKKWTTRQPLLRLQSETPLARAA